MTDASGSGWVQAVVLLGAATVAVPLFRWLGLGSVLGYLAGGLAIVPLLALVALWGAFDGRRDAAGPPVWQAIAIWALLVRWPRSSSMGPGISRGKPNFPRMPWPALRV